MTEEGDACRGDHVSFLEPADGATVKSPITVKMGAEGMTVEKAGEARAGHGHHHILVGHPDGIAVGQVVPKDATHIHYGDGSSETQLELAPGQHTLTLQLAELGRQTKKA